MAFKIFNLLLDRWPKDDRFLVVEIFQNSLRASRWRCNFEKKKIILLAAGSYFLSGTERQEIFGPLRKLFRDFSPRKKEEVFFGLDSSLATTVQSSVILIRDSRSPLSETDLDNLLSQAIWKLFDRERRRAAFKMAVGDLEVMLSDVKIFSIKLDGSRVVNPLGFKARSVELELSETFIPRSLGSGLREIFPEARFEFLKENGITELRTLQKITSLPVFLLANIGDRQTNIFSSEGASLHFVDSLDWGINSLLDALSGVFFLDTEAARLIWERYLNGRLSARLSRRFDEIILSELQLFVNGLERHLERAPSHLVYFSPSSPVPDLVFAPRFARRFSLKPKIRLATMNLLDTWFDWSSRPALKFPIPFFFSAFSNVLEYYFFPRHDTMNKMASRHARWLSSSS